MVIGYLNCCLFRVYIILNYGYVTSELSAKFIKGQIELSV